ncbi:MAG: hypothetical protein NZ602_04020 [Thermoguttaceae bacterium]|nr:hypothetical protein [Thermoguttaceae bacterium]MDW8036583.1 hypothetical protein [Thermoguttaceae bacterium]
MEERTDRRCFLARGILGACGFGLAASLEEQILLAAMEEGKAKPAETENVPPPPDKPLTDIPPGSLPCGKIAGISLSRLIIGGNLIGGWAHSRDLIYVSRLFREYNTEAKVFQTLDLAMACGINTIQLDPACWGVISKYNRHRNPKIQTIVCVPLEEDRKKMKEIIQRQVDMGATMIYSHGGVTDNHFMHGGSTEPLAQMVDLIHEQKLPAGVGSHSLQIPMACERDKIPVDFYMKTLHTDRYWSATPKEHRKEYDWLMPNANDHNANNDAMWCNNPEETAEFMEKVEKPWLAFKVLAAGAIHPNVGFSYAFRNGADFIVVGMFDFQVEADVRIAIEAIQKAANRKRPWRA